MSTRAPDTSRNVLSWATAANCRDDDPELYFDERSVGAALAACRTCPVREQCLAEAMATEGTLKASSRFGIFGGLTSDERAERAAETAPAPAPTPRAPRPGLAQRWAAHESSPCGTRAAYRRHLRHGEQPCGACRSAESRARTDRAKRSAA